jgi:hypothetical protein
LDEKLSTIDEADEDFAAMSKMFKEQLDDELRELFSRIWMKFDKKVNDLEKKEQCDQRRNVSPASTNSKVDGSAGINPRYAASKSMSDERDRGLKGSASSK